MHLAGSFKLILLIMLLYSCHGAVTQNTFMESQGKPEHDFNKSFQACLQLQLDTRQIFKLIILKIFGCE